MRIATSVRAGSQSTFCGISPRNRWTLLFLSWGVQDSEPPYPH